jgi:hypothetical protein
MRRMKVRPENVRVGDKYEINNRGWQDCMKIVDVLPEGGWLTVNERTGGVTKIRSAGRFHGPCSDSLGSIRRKHGCGCGK